MKRISSWLPTEVNAFVRNMTWVTLVVQILIVVTGGAVRLTSSGLGCPAWPTCDGSSIVVTPEMGIHGLIEFVNRLLTFLLVLVAIIAFASVVRMRKTRPDLFWLSISIGLGIPAQAVIGGISVWLKLNPYIVGLHFVVSIALVVLSTIFVLRARTKEPAALIGLAAVFRVAVWVIASLQFLTILMGILTTGSGPHAGDAEAPRNGLNSELLQHLHSFPAYAALIMTLLFVVLAQIGHLRLARNTAIGLLIVNATQAAVGIAQSRLGLPPLLVGLHMLLACLVASTTAVLVYRLRKP